MSGFTQHKLETECCFEIQLVFDKQQPVGFKPWTKLITKEKCRITLPDSTSIDIRPYIDMNGTLDNGALTNFLLNRYNEQI